METLFWIFKVFLVLIGLVASIIVLYRYGERLKLKMTPSKATSSYSMKRTGSMYLGYKKQISIIEINEYVFVLAVGEKEMTLLARWKKPVRSS